MGFQDALNYTLFTNPISSGATSYAWGTVTAIKDYISPPSKVQIIMAPPVPLWKLAVATGPYVRFAGLSGAAAVILGAYGSHRQYPKAKEVNLKQVFETANRYHYIHTLAMLGLPLCRTPYLAATFLISGTVLFCGTCYYYAFTGDKQYSKLTPIGGVCLIIGWLSMCI
ncbi:transmembrane protein 256 homolog isoform X1 [Andrena cerasifolii]|uniref:transmembrane protein 256 homolog isoform X1 n=1 Tax=Andrena cerasifolii TaxID=2819439 RepID=UPI004037EC7F